MMRSAFRFILRHSVYLCALLVSTPPALGAAPARPVVAGIVRAAARLEAAVNARDLNGILAIYAPDSLLRRDAAARYSGTLALDSLRCRERLGGVYLRGDTAEAVVCEEARWTEHGRPQADFSWRSLDFLSRGGTWEIVADREREYAHALWTDLRVDLQPEQGTVSGEAILTVGLTAPGEDALVLRLNRGLTLRSVQGTDGSPMPFSREADVIAVPIPANVLAGQPRHARPASAESLTLHLAFDGTFFNESQEQHYSQVGITPGGSFASWVTNWYPHVAGTDSKSPGVISYTVPAGITVASSGRRTQVVDEGGRSRQVFRADKPLDFSFAAASYFHKSREVDGIDLGVYFLKGGDAKAERYISDCARILKFLHGLYGFYPYDGYAVVELPPNAVGGLGGSSEQGMSLFPAGLLPDSLFPLPLISHEIGHSWWGNLVSGGSAAILDEGLAQTTSLLCVERIAGEKAMRRFLRRGLEMYPQSASDYFTRFAGVQGRDLPLETLSAGGGNGMTLHDLADTKGFFVYEMLRETIGNDAFDRGLRRAVSEFAGKRISLSDLRRIWEKESGRDLGWFFSQWFARIGAPDFQLQYRVEQAGGGFDIRGTVTQSGEPYRVTAGIVIATRGRPSRVEHLAISGQETRFRFHSGARPDTVLFDPGYRILRWTGELRNIALYLSARGFYSAGDTDSASAMLEEYARRAPGALDACTMRGRWKLAAGDLDGAESEFRGVVNLAVLYDADDPAVTAAEVGLGQIEDLRGHRAAAVASYRRALARDDGSPAIDDASAYLATPFRQPPPPPAADPAILEKCVGTYEFAGMPIQVSMGGMGRLRVTIPDMPPFGLQVVDGSHFLARGDTPASFDFSGDGPRYSELTVQIQDRVIHLTRKE